MNSFKAFLFPFLVIGLSLGTSPKRLVVIHGKSRAIKRELIQIDSMTFCDSTNATNGFQRFLVLHQGDSAIYQNLARVDSVTFPDSIDSTPTARSRIDFKLGTGRARFNERLSFSCLVFDNKMWVIGGYDSRVSGQAKSDAWSSSNGTDWIKVTDAAAFGRVHRHASVVFNGKMWVIGGLAKGGNCTNAVWNSNDGATWTEQSIPGFSPRRGHTATVYQNRIWVIGGADENGRHNDVWSSSDGVTWQCVVDSAPFPVRHGHTCTAYDNKLWVIGGSTGHQNLDDVWCSTDGVNWARTNQPYSIMPKTGHATVVYENKLWIVGGRGSGDYSGGRRNDVWYSADGASWIQANDSTCFSGWMGFESVVFDKKLWVVGGEGRDMYISGDVFYGITSPDTVVPAPPSGWKYLGNRGFASVLQDGTVMAVDSSGRVYVATTAGSILACKNGDWVQVGKMPDGADGIVLAASQTALYAAFRDSGMGNRVTVMKYENQKWDTVGNRGFTPGKSSGMRIDVDAGIPYIAYKNRDDLYRAFVMKYEAGDWITVGGRNATEDYVRCLQFDVENGTPFVGYSKYYAGTGNRGSVKKYNGSDWVFVGKFRGIRADGFGMVVLAGFPSKAYRISNSEGVVVTPTGTGKPKGMHHFYALAHHNGDWMVAFSDSQRPWKMSVRRQVGQTWELVGGGGFSDGRSTYPHMVAYKNRVYVGFRDENTGNKFSVMYYDF